MVKDSSLDGWNKRREEEILLSHLVLNILVLDVLLNLESGHEKRGREASRGERRGRKTHTVGFVFLPLKSVSSASKNSLGSSICFCGGGMRLRLRVGSDARSKILMIINFLDNVSVFVGGVGISLGKHTLHSWFPLKRLGISQIDKICYE